MLLRAYFGVTLAYYVGRGRAPLNLKAFFTDPSLLHPSIPGPQPIPSHDALSANKPEYCITPNPWFSILQAALVHPDEHVPAVQRALKHFAELYEHVERGHFAELTELEGGEYIDGTLFLRAAVLSANRFGWLREGQSLKDFAQGDSGYMANFVWDATGYFPHTSP
jgi:Questin oxidase-like